MARRRSSNTTVEALTSFTVEVDGQEVIVQPGARLPVSHETVKRAPALFEETKPELEHASPTSSARGERRRRDELHHPADLRGGWRGAVALPGPANTGSGSRCDGDVPEQRKCS